MFMLGSYYRYLMYLEQQKPQPELYTHEKCAYYEQHRGVHPRNTKKYSAIQKLCSPVLGNVVRMLFSFLPSFVHERWTNLEACYRVSGTLLIKQGDKKLSFPSELFKYCESRIRHCLPQAYFVCKADKPRSFVSWLHFLQVDKPRNVFQPFTFYVKKDGQIQEHGSRRQPKQEISFLSHLC